LPGFAGVEMFTRPSRRRRGLHFSNGIPVSDIQERRVGDLRIRIDRNLCVGFGDCIEAAEAAFELDDEGIAVFRESIDEVDRATLMNACDECPVDAISVLDSDGTQLLP
jgi:ferredoxin